MAPKQELLPPSGFFAGAEHHFPVRVYFEDTDLSGVVYHANYLRYMERARSDMLRVAGIDQRAAQEAGTGHYAVTEAAVRFLAPARLDDALTVRSHLATLSPVRCVIAQAVYRGETLLAKADVTVAFVDPSGRPRRQPSDWIARFNTLLPTPT